MRNAAALGQIKHAHYALIVKVVSRAFSPLPKNVRDKEPELCAFPLPGASRHSVHSEKGLA